MFYRKCQSIEIALNTAQFHRIIAKSDLETITKFAFLHCTTRAVPIYMYKYYVYVVRCFLSRHGRSKEFSRRILF